MAETKKAAWRNVGENLESMCDGSHVYFRSAIKAEYPLNPACNYRVATSGGSKSILLPDGRQVRAGVNLSIDRDESDLSPEELATRTLNKSLKKSKK